MAREISLRKVKALQGASLKEKVKMIEKNPHYLIHLTIPEQLYFVNLDVEKYFQHCDEEIVEFMMRAFPDYFVAFASDDVKEYFTDCGLIDPGYLDGFADPIPMTEDMLASCIMCYAKENLLTETLKQDYPKDFKGVEPAEYR